MLDAPKLGQYPYPRRNSQLDSPAMTWLRNHSSYLTADGPLGTVGALAIYIRGVVGNLLIVTPVLIVVGMTLGVCHRWIIDHTTLIVASYALLTLVLFGIYFGNAAVTRMVTPLDHRDKPTTNRPTESEPTDPWYTRCLKNGRGLAAELMRQPVGTFVGIGFFVLLFIASPWIIELFWRTTPIKNFTLEKCLAVITTLIAVSGGITKQLGGLGKLGAKIGLAAIALIGLAILWLITLRIATFIYYGTPPTGLKNWFPFGIAFACLVTSFATCFRWAPGRKQANFNRISVPAVFVSIVLLILGWLLVDELDTESAADKDGLVPLTQAVSQLNRSAQKILNGRRGEPSESVDPEYRDKLSGLSPAISGTLRELELLNQKLTLRFQAGALNDQETLNPEDYYLAQTFLHQGESLGKLTPSDKQLLVNALTEPCVVSLTKTFAKVLQPTADDERSTGNSSEANKVVWRELGRDAIALEVFRSQKNFRDTVFLDDSMELSAANKLRVIESLNAARAESKDWINQQIDDDGSQKANGEAKRKQSMLRQLQLLMVDDLSSTGAKADTQRLSAVQTQVAQSLQIDSSGSNQETIPEGIVENWVSTSMTAGFDDLQQTIRCVVMTERLRGLPGLGKFPRKLVDADLATNRDEDVLCLVRLALCGNDQSRRIARELLGELYDPSLCPIDCIPVDSSLNAADARVTQERLYEKLYRLKPGSNFPAKAVQLILASHIVQGQAGAADQLIRRMVAGPHGNLEGIEKASHQLFKETRYGRIVLMSVCGGMLMLFNFAFNSPNLTSIHSFYRDRLRTAFIVQPADGNADSDDKQDVVPRERILLSNLMGSNMQSGSPYPLICGALNLQGSRDQTIRDRQASSFLFSPLFVGSDRTKYVSTVHLEQVDNDLTADSAMALSAAAAAPNMGKFTVSWVSFLIVLLNVRLGRWIPHPASVAATIAEEDVSENSQTTASTKVVNFFGVRTAEAAVIDARRRAAKVASRSKSTPSEQASNAPSGMRNLFGLALSGGGIRSASIALGVTQTLYRSGLFRELDYLSSVSGGGYTATAISTFMGVCTTADETEEDRSECADAEQSERDNEATEAQEVELPSWKRWWHRPASRYLLREMTGRIRESLPWNYVSDGGHFENLAAYELLKRKARVIIVSDGEADGNGSFGGLATLMRLAEIDLNTRIAFGPNALESLVLRKPEGTEDSDRWRSDSNFAIGRIYYDQADIDGVPDGWLLYLRSTLLVDEDAIIENYARVYKSFPHQSTGDQSFDELQFEAYRRLGESVMARALEKLDLPREGVSYGQLLEALTRCQPSGVARSSS